jgi:hypothetical protein
MSEDLLIGLAATALPLLALGFLLLRGSPVIFRFFMGLLLVGLGYLGVTGALDDIGRIVKGEQEPIVAPAAAPVQPSETTPAPAEPPAAEPLAPAEAPVGEPAPAPVEATPEETGPEPEASPPPPETLPGGDMTPPDALPPANP